MSHGDNISTIGGTGYTRPKFGEGGNLPLRAGLSLTLRWIIGGLFLWAGVAKMVSPLKFYAALQIVEWMPELLRQSVATVLPPLEVLMGLSLILNLYASASWLIVAVLTPIFITFHLLYPGGCGCFGE